jgi:hypothetical protein
LTTAFACQTKIARNYLWKTGACIASSLMFAADRADPRNMTCGHSKWW